MSAVKSVLFIGTDGKRYELRDKNINYTAEAQFPPPPQSEVTALKQKSRMKSGRLFGFYLCRGKNGLLAHKNVEITNFVYGCEV